MGSNPSRGACAAHMDTREKTIMKSRFLSTLVALLAGFTLVATQAVAQVEPTPPSAAAVPGTPDELKAAAQPLRLEAAGGQVYIGAQGGYYVGARSRLIIKDYANPPKYFDNSLTYTGGNASWWVLKWDGLNNVYYAIPTPSSGGREILFWDAAHNRWVHWDNATNGPNQGNGN